MDAEATDRRDCNRRDDGWRCTQVHLPCPCGRWTVNVAPMPSPLRPPLRGYTSPPMYVRPHCSHCRARHITAGALDPRTRHPHSRQIISCVHTRPRSLSLWESENQVSLVLHITPLRESRRSMMQRRNSISHTIAIRPYTTWVQEWLRQTALGSPATDSDERAAQHARELSYVKSIDTAKHRTVIVSRWVRICL